MRVLHVQKVKGIGGSERHLLGLLPALRNAGVDARVIVLAAGNGHEAFGEAMIAADVPVDVVTVAERVDPLVGGRLARLVRASRPQLLHTHLIHADLYGAVAGVVARVPTVASVHGVHDFYRRQPVRSAAHVALHRARRVIAISHFVGEYLERLNLARRERVRVVPYGIGAVPEAPDRATARRRLGVPEDAMVVGMAARLIPGKGHDLALRALDLCASRTPPVRLLIAGDGALRGQLTAEAARRPGSDVTLTGFLDDMESFYAACDALLFPTDPSLGEGFGLAALEAMARGVPVIATRVASLPEVVGTAGVLVPPGDPKAIAKAIQELADHADLRRRLGIEGAERAQRYSLPRLVETTMAVYREALGSR